MAARALYRPRLAWHAQRSAQLAVLALELPVTGPRELLDAYAAEPDYAAVEGKYREHLAPKTFAALRNVLKNCDFLDACIANYKGYEVAALIRNGITKALEEA